MPEGERLSFDKLQLQWLQEQQVTPVLSGPDLQQLAAQLHAPSPDEQRLIVTDYAHLYSEADNLSVYWPAPYVPFNAARHQAELTRAVGVALLKARDVTQRHTVTRWGILVGGVGLAVFSFDYLQHGEPGDGWVKYVGMAIGAAGLSAVAWINTRRRPNASSLPDELHGTPIRLEQNE